MVYKEHQLFSNLTVSVYKKLSAVQSVNRLKLSRCNSGKRLAVDGKYYVIVFVIIRFDGKNSVFIGSVKDAFPFPRNIELKSKFIGEIADLCFFKALLNFAEGFLNLG